MKLLNAPCVKMFLTTAVMAVCFGAMPSTAQQNVSGSWSFVDPLPYFPIHTHLLPTGNVMIWPGDGGVSGNDPRSWNPFDQSVTLLARPGLDLFCSGHSFLSDGTLFVAGGHIQNSVGLSQASRYNPVTDSWTFFPNMNAGRWYPTATVLGNGDVLVVSGDVDTSVGVNTLPQVLQLSAPTPTWRDLTTAQLGLELYPPMLLAPNGKVFNPGPSTTTRYLDTSGTGAWSVVAERVGGWSSTGSAVMYDSGKVLIMGGGDPPTNTAEVIDLNSATPTWRQVGSMQFARRQLNTTLLPDGQVLVTGGTSAPGFSEPSGAVYAAELWNPSTETWTTLASGSIPRLYHSTALLLLDGRVMVTGGNGYPDTEIYSPPYLYKGARPTTTSAPSRVAYGQSFFVPTPEATTISKVTLLRLSSVTHSFNQSQYINAPSFSQTTGGLNITVPANGNVVPPGPYMLHLVNGSGVPSLGKVLLLGPAQQPADTVMPTVAMTAPSAGSTVSGIITLAATASDNVGVDRVDFYVNSLVVASASRGPYQVSWDSRSSTNGTVALSARAYDVAGNNQSSASVPITVSNAATPAPTLTSLSPNSAEAGGASFTLTVNGTNFLNGSTVRWNGIARTTTFMSATQVTAAINADDVATAGTAQVTVANPDRSVSNVSTFTITNSTAPVPSLASISPNTATSGSPRFTLTVSGSNFVTGSVVRWNGTSRATTYANSSQLTAAIPAGDVALDGTAQVTVASPGGGVSGASTFTTVVDTSPPTSNITSPVDGATVSGLVTIAASASDNVGVARVDFYVDTTMVGSTSSSPYQITWDSSTRANGGATLAVKAYDATGNYKSSPNVSVTVNNLAASGPTVSSLSPSSATAGGAAFTLSVNGTNFVSGSSVRWNGAARTSTFVSSTQLTAAIAAADIAASGTAQVNVANPDGSVSNASTFTIAPDTQPPTATITAPTGGSTVSGVVTLTATATDNVGVTRVDFYVNTTLVGSASSAPYQVTWDSRSRANGDIALNAQAFDAAGNYRSSANVFVTIANGTPPPTVSSLSPNSATAGGVAFTLTVNGTNFVSGSSVRWNGAARTSTFVSSTRLTAAIAAADIAVSGTAPVTVVNPDASVSNASTFTIAAPAPDTQPPTVTITAPTGGSTVSGVVTLSASATDNVGVARVDFYVNTTLVGSAISASYQVTWDSRSRANGNVALSAKAFDAAGNYRSSANVFVTIANP
jgi:galactose oxidase-like protein/Big-like domain-containing protein/Kelch motif protein